MKFTGNNTLPALLELRDLHKEFPGVIALDGVSLSLHAGEIHTLCGENGAGKSTLLKILAGVYAHASYGGELLLEGRTLSLKSPQDAEREGIVLVAQELNLVGPLSVAENIFLGRERSAQGWRMDWPTTLTQAGAALQRVGLDQDPSTLAENLSIGAQQMVEIARALQQKARILILDEPTAALGEADAIRLLDLVREIARAGTAVLYVSHRMEEVFQLSDTITVLRDGKSVRSAPVSEWTREGVVAAMVGRDLSAAAAWTPPASGRDLALELRHWSVERPGAPGLKALKDLHLSLYQGEILGLGGLMGSGRTALLSTLFGHWKALGQGELRLGGAAGAWRPPFQSPAEAISEGICLASEDRKRLGLVAPASVEENLALASLPSLSIHGRLDWDRLSAAASVQAEALQVKAPSLQVAVETLSGGNQQKVVLGRWLLLGPKVLLLDEPTRGIDVGAKAEIHRLIHRLAAQGMAVLLASSELPELLALCHRVLVLADGRLAGELQRNEFTPEALMHLATS
jgi:D-xylose transport system ATP-binding protein